MIQKEPLDKKTIHELAIVFAQSKLLKSQQESPELDDESQIRVLYTSYISALTQMVVDNKQMEVEIKSSSEK